MNFWKTCKGYACLLGMFAGVLFLGLGVWQGQHEDIWKKAVMICLECIGLG